MVYIYTYIWLIFMVNVAKYSIHGYYGVCKALKGFEEPRNKVWLTSMHLVFLSERRTNINKNYICSIEFFLALAKSVQES